ncbi:hypothetical protein B0H14DRAFT_2686997, partial [Mycena olivaceomarginata]
MSVYPHPLRDSNVVEWNADSLLADPTVSDYLGKEPIISASDHEDFGKEFGDRTIWPLVESVHIRGPFPVLSTGITLLPRDKVANEYMRDASTVFLVTSIARAIDERVRLLFLPTCPLILIECRTRTSTLKS